MHDAERVPRPQAHPYPVPHPPALPATRAARLVARDLLDALAAARPRLDLPDDPEALHDYRVALRRLRSWLRAYDAELREGIGRKARRRLRRLARATGERRDLDVHLAWLLDARPRLRAAERPGVDWLVDRLAGRAAHADVALRAAVARDHDRVHAALLDGVHRYTAHLDDDRPDARWGTVAATRAVAQLAELRARLAGVRSLADQDEAHEARIAGKRLRYLLEPFRGAIAEADAAVQALKALQDDLGDLHDAHVFGLELEEAQATQAREAGEAAAMRADAEVARPRRRPPDPAVGLAALVERLRARERAAFADAWARCLGDGGAALTALVEAAAAALRTAAGGMREIERKYLLRAMPDVARAAPRAEIEQGYLPGERLVERVRRVRDADGERWYRTVKLGAGVERVEVEEPTPRALGRALWRLTAGRRVRKRRHLVPEGALTWEIDDFRDRRLVLAEVELPAADTPVPIPDWLAAVLVREVTDEGAYTNARLAR